MSRDPGAVYLSVVVITRNEEKYIADCLDSLLASLSDVEWSWEVIHVDSASTDRTVEVAK